MLVAVLHHRRGFQIFSGFQGSVDSENLDFKKNIIDDLRKKIAEKLKTKNKEILKISLNLIKNIEEKEKEKEEADF